MTNLVIYVLVPLTAPYRASCLLPFSCQIRPRGKPYHEDLRLKPDFWLSPLYAVLTFSSLLGLKTLQPQTASVPRKEVPEIDAMYQLRPLSLPDLNWATIRFHIRNVLSFRTGLVLTHISSFNSQIPSDFSKFSVLTLFFYTLFLGPPETSAFTTKLPHHATST
jgi:hypothetical protein